MLFAKIGHTHTPTTVRTGQVLSCSGLGETAVAAITALSHPTDTVHGEVGGLTCAACSACSAFSFE